MICHWEQSIVGLGVYWPSRVDGDFLVMEINDSGDSRAIEDAVCMGCISYIALTRLVPLHHTMFLLCRPSLAVFCRI